MNSFEDILGSHMEDLLLECSQSIIIHLASMELMSKVGESKMGLSLPKLPPIALTL